MFTAWPFDVALPSSETIPAMPDDGCTKPDPATSSAPMVRLRSKGVRMTLAGGIGPALPSSFTEPPPTTSAARENGKDDAAEKSRNSMLTFWSVRGLVFAPVLSVRRPLEIFTSFTDRAVGLELAAAGVGGAAFAGVLPPKLEKFQSPAAD